MKTESNKLNWNDFYKLFFCGLILLVVFWEKISLPNIGEWIIHITMPDLVNYPYQSPPVFFSIGEALSSIAILLAIYQFKKDKWSIALKVRNYIRPTILATISLGVVLSFVSPFILFKTPTNIFELSIFWQAVGGIFIIFSIVFLFLKATNKGLFNSRTAKKFYEVLHWELSRPSPERLEIILNTLLDNFENICKSAIGDEKLEVTQLSSAILDVILGEGSLVDLVTTKRLDALHYILAVFEKYNINYRQARGFTRIVKNLFVDQESFLYKHLEMSGLALSANLYDHLFGSPQILTNFDLFGWRTIDYSTYKNPSSTQINVFIKALSRAIETYLKTGSIPPRHINNGLSHLSEIFGDICVKINIEEKRGVDTKYALKDEWWSLHTIADFLGHEYPFLGRDETLNPIVIETEKTAKKAGFFSDITINEGVAASLYKAFEQLTYIKRSNDTYHTVLDLLHGMIYSPDLKQGYRDPFEKRIWEQIARNVIEHYYPAPLRTYLMFIGFCLASDDNQRTGWIGEQAERMRRLLYVDLKPQLERAERMVDKTPMQESLLPDCMTYEGGKFTYRLGFGEGEKVFITEPPEGSESALKNVDLKNVSFLL
jgi:hypothetical protein